jgi:hypothetical protein
MAVAERIAAIPLVYGRSMALVKPWVGQADLGGRTPSWPRRRPTPDSALSDETTS